MWASSNSYADIVKLLIDAGDDVNVREPDGGTALLFACENVEIIKFLKDAGATE